jgi:cytochrome c oxidase accessory protein FixG
MREDDLIKAKSFRDRVSTVTNSGTRNWIYALKPEGRFYNIREKLAWVYLAVFFLLPFIKVDDMPFFLFNVVEAKFILFGKIFWPQDFFIFAIAMVTFIVFIVLFTVVFGRLFCGWACPQTIFMEFVFRRIEWLIEGSPAQQKKLNEEEWNGKKLFKKTLKHFIFLVFSFAIANMFLAYIIGVDELYKIISEPVMDHLALLSGLLVFTGLFYGVFAFVREIVCTTVCPYGRLQGVMFDKDTMQIAYDYNRGEPRGKLSKNQERTQGDCIDCKKCVMVCPTGIDIRNGLQMECVGCTACIDACDDVMDKMKFPRGLIRYASENEITTGVKFRINSRTKAYSVLLVVLTGIMFALIITRKSVDTYITRVKGQTYQEVGETAYSNLFEAKIINKTKKEIPVELKMEDFDGRIKIIGVKNIVLKGESINEVTFFIEINKDKITTRNTDIHIGVYSGGEKIQDIKTKFLGPFI